MKSNWNSDKFPAEMQNGITTQKKSSVDSYNIQSALTHQFYSWMFIAKNKKKERKKQYVHKNTRVRMSLAALYKIGKN